MTVPLPAAWPSLEASEEAKQSPPTLSTRLSHGPVSGQPQSGLFLSPSDMGTDPALEWVCLGGGGEPLPELDCGSH